MAVVFLFRLAIAVAPTVLRVCKTSGCDANQAANAIGRVYGRLFDPDADPSELSAEGTASLGAEGGVFEVTDFTGTFELRKLQWRLNRTPTTGVAEDQDVMTFHWIKVSAGSPVAWVDGTDLPNLETQVDAYWTAIKSLFRTTISSSEFRWYKDGPAFYELRGGSYKPLLTGNPAVRVTARAVPGTSASSAQLPPQVAMSITERTSQRAHWGRWYLPSPGTAVIEADGRIAETTRTTLVSTAVAFYNACRSAGYVPVVWSIQKPDRPNAAGETMPAVAARAFEVTAIQVDNLFDVIRRRRYDLPTAKGQTPLT